MHWQLEPTRLDLEVEKLTRNEKAKIKKDADEQQQKGMPLAML